MTSRHVGITLATAFGAGFSPIAPGTCGALVAVPLLWLLAALPWWQLLLVGTAITLVGVWAADVADRAWNTHDSGRIVIDEVAGMFFTVLFVPRDNWVALALGFVLFRFFDIAKPPPVRLIDRSLPGGWGVMLDDVAAGILACAALWALWQLDAVSGLSF